MSDQMGLSLRRHLAVALIGVFVLSTAPQCRAADQVAGGWQIHGRDGVCAIMRPLDQSEPTWVLLSRDVDGTQFIRVHDRRWKVKKGKHYAVAIDLNGRPVSLDGIGAITDGQDRLAGFTASSSADWQSAMISSSTMKVTLPGNAPVSIDLSGASAALAALEACISQQRDAHAIALRSGPYPTTTLTLSPNDYPAQALAEHRGGRVGIRLTVDKAGSPSRCEVTDSSGYADLDQRSCQLALERMRFKPAVATNGMLAEGSFQFRIAWNR